MTAPRLTWRPLDVPAVAWWSERDVPALLAVEVGAAVMPRRSWLAVLAIVLVVVILSFAVMTRLSQVQTRLFPDRHGAGPVARENGLGRRLREGGYVPPEERSRAGRVAWSALVTTTISCWASLIFAGAVITAVGEEPVGSLENVVGTIALLAGLVMLAHQIRDSARWRHIATDRFAVRAPVLT